MSIWERFNDIANTDEVAEAKAQFVPLEAGTYPMKLEELKVVENDAGLPVVKGRLRTETNKVVFYNQNIQNISYPEMTAKNIASVIKFVSGLLGSEVEYTNFVSLVETIESVPIGGMHTIKVTYRQNKDKTKEYINLEVVNDSSPFDVTD